MVDLNRVFFDHAWAANAAQASTVSIASQFVNSAPPSFSDVLASTQNAADEFETQSSQNEMLSSNPLMRELQGNASWQSPAAGSDAAQNETSNDAAQNNSGGSSSSASETPQPVTVQPAKLKEQAKEDVYVQSAARDRSPIAVSSALSATQQGQSYADESAEAKSNGKSKHSKPTSDESSSVQKSSGVVASRVNDAVPAPAPGVGGPSPAPGDQRNAALSSNNQKKKADDSNTDLAFAVRVQCAGLSSSTAPSLSTSSPDAADLSSASSPSPFSAQLSAMLAPSGSKTPVSASPVDSSGGPAALTIARNQTASPAPQEVSADTVEEETPVVTEATEAITPQIQPVKAVQVQVAGADNQRVEVRLLEKSGALTISVRSTDSNLTKALQQNLPELNTKLNEQQIRAEWWKPESQASDSLTKPESSPNSSGNGNSAAQDQSSRDKGNSDQQGGRSSRQTDWLEELSNLHKSTQNGTQFSWQL